MYVDVAPPPWDIGRPQAAFVRLAAEGLLSGTLLDAGCGTGDTHPARSHPWRGRTRCGRLASRHRTGPTRSGGKGCPSRLRGRRCARPGPGADLRHHPRQRLVPCVRRRRSRSIRDEPGVTAPTAATATSCASATVSPVTSVHVVSAVTRSRPQPATAGSWRASCRTPSRSILFSARRSHRLGWPASGGNRSSKTRSRLGVVVALGASRSRHQPIPFRHNRYYRRDRVVSGQQRTARVSGLR